MTSPPEGGFFHACLFPIAFAVFVGVGQPFPMSPISKKNVPQNVLRDGFWLADQVSNLDSSEPKSDVLPVTPSAIFTSGSLPFL